MSLILGELIIICINQFLISNKKGIKALSLTVLGIGLGVYTLLDAGDLIAFRNLSIFTYLALGIWLILEKKNLIKFEKLDWIWYILSLSVGLIAAIAFRYLYHFTETTTYSGGKNGLAYLFSYGYSMFLPFLNFENKYLFSSFLSIFPVSLIVAMIYVYKTEKHEKFLMPLIVVIVLQSIFCMTKLPLFKIIGWKSTWNMSLCASAIGLVSVYLYIYMLANIDENIFPIKTSMRMTLALLVFYFLIPKPEIFMSRGYMYGLACLITLLYFMFINFGNPKYKKVLLVILVIWSVISSAPVLFI